MDHLDRPADGLPPSRSGLREPESDRRARGRVVVILVLVAGLAVALRLRMMLVGRSLWLDEAALALNICGRTFGELLGPLDHDQAAPIGFLFVERVSVLALGPTEFALRLFPFVCSILSLILIYRFSVRNLGQWSALVALSLTGVMPALIYYAGELKQYSSDVTAGLLILTLASNRLRMGWNARRAIELAIAGMVLVWFSHPSVFILAGVGTTLILSEVGHRRYKAIWIPTVISVCWLVSFGLEYSIFLKDLQTNSNLTDYWDAAFLKFPPRSAGDLRLYPAIGFGIFESLFHNAQVDVDLSLRMGVLMAALWMIGLITLYRQGQRELLALLVMPLVFAVAASALHKYPLKSRLSLFAAATTLPMIAAGVAGQLRSADAVNRAIGGVFLFCALLLPTMQGAQFLMERPRLHDARGVLTQVARDWQLGDHLVVDRYSELPFRYYQLYGRIDRLDRLAVTSSQLRLTEPEELAKEVEQWKGVPRVWFLLDTALPDPINLSRGSLKVILDQVGEPIESFSCRRYSAHLYSFDSRSLTLRRRRVDPESGLIPTTAFAP